MNYESNITKGRDGFKAQTVIPLEGTEYTLHVNTYKPSRGGLTTYACAVKYSPDGCLFSHMTFQDFSRTLCDRRDVRCTEKNVVAQHLNALEGIEAVILAARAHYAPERAPLVA